MIAHHIWLTRHRFSDRWDVFALTLGTLGAIINGAGFPVLAIILGSVTNSIGLNQGNTQELESQVNQRVPYFIYLGIVSAGAAFCQGFFWSASSVRQVNRIRFLYLQRVLRQDITYYDTVGTSGKGLFL